MADPIYVKVDDVTMKETVSTEKQISVTKLLEDKARLQAEIDKIDALLVKANEVGIITE